MGQAERLNPFNQWKRANNATPASQRKVYDLFGREVGENDGVHLLGRGGTMWRVVKCQESLHPQAKPGTIELVLVASFVTNVPGGIPIEDLIKVYDASEVQQPPPTVPEGTVQQ